MGARREGPKKGAGQTGPCCHDASVLSGEDQVYSTQVCFKKYLVLVESGQVAWEGLAAMSGGAEAGGNNEGAGQVLIQQSPF